MPSTRQRVAMIAMQAAAQGDEPWSAGKVDRIAQQIDQGDRTPTSVYQDAMRRLGRPVDTAFLGRINDNPPGDSRTASQQPPAAVSVAEDRTATAAERTLANTYANQLRQDGLEELIPYVDDWLEADLSWPEILARLDDVTTAEGRVIDMLYPERRLRREANRAPMTIAQIRQYRDTARALMRAEGVPEGFYDSNEDFTRFIVDDVSIAEVRDRIGEYSQFGAQIAAGAGGELDLFQRAYGVQPTAFELAALVLNPDKALPALRRQFSAVKLDVAAGRAGFGDLTGGEAERLADVGVDPGQAVAGFGALVDSKELFDALPGRENSEDTIGRADQFGAVFEGNANARRRIERQASKRKAEFGGGGSFANGREGFGGIGRAS